METQVLTLAPLTELGTPTEIVKWFGGKAGYQQAVRELTESLYSA